MKTHTLTKLDTTLNHQPSSLANGTTTSQLIDLWVHGKSPRTAELYRRVAGKLTTSVDKPIQWLTLQDLQSFADMLEGEGLSAASRRTYLSVMKSLLSFAHRVGFTQVNASVAIANVKPKDCLSQKILTEGEVLLMIASESNQRNKLILKVLYYCGLRVSELCGLSWCDLTSNGESGQLLIYGKGSKTRVVLLPKPLYLDLLKLRGDAGDNDPIFRSRKGSNDGRLNRITVTNLVKSAAVKVGISEKTSAHWLRHCHASHSLDRGSPIHLVSQTLGHSSVATTSKYLHAKPNDSSGLYLPF